LFLKDDESGALVRVLDPEELFNPVRARVRARSQRGEEEQDPAEYAKSALRFPSGEPLPRCWTDPGYRDREPAPPADRSAS